MTRIQQLQRRKAELMYEMADWRRDLFVPYAQKPYHRMRWQDARDELTLVENDLRSLGALPPLRKKMSARALGATTMTVFTVLAVLGVVGDATDNMGDGVAWGYAIGVIVFGLVAGCIAWLKRAFNEGVHEARGRLS